MAVPIIKGIVEIVKNITILGNKIVDSADSEKYANDIYNLNKDVEETYVKMRELISNDDTLTTDQKLEKLEKLANSQQVAKKSCEEAIKGNREHISKIIGEIFLALTTCGISYIPKVLNSQNKHNTKKLNVSQNDNKLIITNTQN
jgi:hypothetical protein